MKALITEAALHQLEVAQFVRVRSIWLSEDALIEHLLVDFEELFLGTINVDQGRDDIIFSSL